MKYENTMSNDGNYMIRTWDPGFLFPGTSFKSRHSRSKWCFRIFSGQSAKKLMLEKKRPSCYCITLMLMLSQRCVYTGQTHFPSFLYLYYGFTLPLFKPHRAVACCVTWVFILTVTAGIRQPVLPLPSLQQKFFLYMTRRWIWTSGEGSRSQRRGK